MDLLDQFVAAGGRRLDLANVYGQGSASRIVGHWLAGVSSSTAVTLYVKGCHPPFCAPSFVRQEVDSARKSLSVS
jgi:aryl-alcohol dehydrogenase-like predicted oxidoreductase